MKRSAPSDCLLNRNHLFTPMYQSVFRRIFVKHILSSVTCFCLVCRGRADMYNDKDNEVLFVHQEQKCIFYDIDVIARWFGDWHHECVPHDSRLNSAFMSYCYLGLNHLSVQLDVYNIGKMLVQIVMSIELSLFFQSVFFYFSPFVVRRAVLCGK